MQMVARAIHGALAPEARNTVTLVPIPPSKMVDDPEYDPRMAQIAKAVTANTCEAINAIAPREPMHEADQRIRPNELAETLELRMELLPPEPIEIILIDDVITTGCSFVTCHDLIREQLPNITISGVFAARRAIMHDWPDPPMEVQ